MKCYDCVRKDYCTYIHQFNHDLNVGCTDFQDRDCTTYVSDTLNTVNTTSNSTNSKALEVSKQLKEFVLEFVNNGLDKMFVQGSFDIIEDALKALQIIKEKKVDVEQLIENPDWDNVIWYNTSFTGVLCESWRMLTQEEFDLLRGVLL